MVHVKSVRLLVVCFFPIGEHKKNMIYKNRKPSLIPRYTISNNNNTPTVVAHKESIFPTFVNLYQMSISKIISFFFNFI